MYEREHAEHLRTRRRRDRPRAVARAAELLADPARLAILDTETTGIPFVRPGKRQGADPRTWLADGTLMAHCYARPAWIVDLGVIDGTGAVLLETLVRPGVPIPAEAQAVHHISDAMTAAAPDFAAVLPELEKALAGRTCLIWNANFDVAVLHCELMRLHGVAEVTADLPEWWAGLDTPVECAMSIANDYRGEWDSYRRDYRYTKLPNPDPGAHRTVSDCRATLAALSAIAADTFDPPPRPEPVGKRAGRAHTGGHDH